MYRSAATAAATLAVMTADEPQPILRRLLEDVAAVMELDEGETRLELCFADGHLTRWYAHRRGNVKALHVFDDRAAHLIAVRKLP